MTVDTVSGDFLVLTFFLHNVPLQLFANYDCFCGRSSSLHSAFPFLREVNTNNHPEERKVT